MPYPYVKTNWVNQSIPALNQLNLNKLETAVADAYWHRGATPPAAPPLGKFWQDTTTSPSSLRVWNGVEWEVVGAQSGGGDSGPGTPATLNYQISNLSVDRDYNANSTSIEELSDVLGTLIQDLKGGAAGGGGTAGLLAVDGVSNTGGNVDFVAGLGMDIQPSLASKNITFKTHSINNMTNPGGNVQISPGAGISIANNNTTKTITITNTGGGGGGGGGTGVGSISGVFPPVAGGELTLAGANGVAIVPEPASNTIYVSGQSINNVTNPGGNIQLIGAGGIFISPSDANNSITISGGGTGGGASREVLQFYFTETLSVRSTGLRRLREPATLKRVWADGKQGSSGPVTFQVRKGAVGSNPSLVVGGSLVILANQRSGDLATLNVPVNANDWIDVNIPSVPSTPGHGWLVNVEVEY